MQPPKQYNIRLKNHQITPPLVPAKRHLDTVVWSNEEPRTVTLVFETAALEGVKPGDRVSIASQGVSDVYEVIGDPGEHNYDVEYVARALAAVAPEQGSPPEGFDPSAPGIQAISEGEPRTGTIDID